MDNLSRQKTNEEIVDLSNIIHKLDLTDIYIYMIYITDIYIYIYIKYIYKYISALPTTEYTFFQVYLEHSPG